MKCLIVSVITLFVSLNSHNQRNLGVTIKSGISEFKQISRDKDFLKPNTITTAPDFYWGIVADGENQLSKFISIQSQIGYSNMRANQTETYFITNLEYEQANEFRSETWRNTHYLSLLSFLNYHPTEKFAVAMLIFN